jgi:ketosteroid isomerase-like protein
MSNEQNITTVREIYDAVGRGDVAGILDRVTDDVDWAADAVGGAAPWYGQRAGKDGVASFFEDLAGSVEILNFEPHNFASGDDTVQLLVSWTFRPLTNGHETAMTMHHYWRLRDGKVECFRGSEDTALTAQALAG